MARPGWTFIGCAVTAADGARLSQLIGTRPYNAWLREVLNDWLEAQGEPVLQDGGGRGRQPRREGA